MNIDNLTFRQIKEIIGLFGEKIGSDSLNCQVGQLVVVRACSDRVWFGKLEEKSGNEVILTHARTLWMWWARESISLSGVAKYGIRHDKSKIAPPVKMVWLEVTEIYTLTDTAIASIELAENAKPE